MARSSFSRYINSSLFMFQLWIIRIKLKETVMQCRDYVHLHRLVAQKPRYMTWSPTLASAFFDKHFSQRKNYFQRILFSQRKIKNCVLVKLPKAIKTVIVTECSKWLGLRLKAWKMCGAIVPLGYQLMSELPTNKAVIFFSCPWKSPGALLYKSDGDARRKIEIKPLWETNVGVSQA